MEGKGDNVEGKGDKWSIVRSIVGYLLMSQRAIVQRFTMQAMRDAVKWSTTLSIKCNALQKAYIIIVRCQLLSRGRDGNFVHCC